MSKFSLEKLQDRLDKELAWRKKELTLMKSSIEIAEGESLNTLLRAGISLLYAHWEGYVKIAARAYLTFLNDQNCTLSELQEHFTLLHLKKTIIDIRETNKVTRFADLIQKMNNKDNEIFKVKEKDPDIISTRSNLKFKVLKEILFSLGLDDAKFARNQYYIDEKLVEIRNRIAHGEYTSFLKQTSDPSKVVEEFKELYHIILDLLDEFRDQIIEAGMNKNYLKVAVR